jgi:hypothetical protein
MVGAQCFVAELPTVHLKNGFVSQHLRTESDYSMTGGSSVWIAKYFHVFNVADVLSEKLLKQYF